MRRSLLVAAALALTVSFAAIVTPPPAATQTNTTVRRDVVYREVDGEELTVDVFLPPDTGVDHPAVLVIHGGGWTEGDKNEVAWAGRGLAAYGFVGVTVDYRLAPEHEHPAALKDVEAAIRWLRKPRQLDAYDIDPTRIAAAGGSAGGHLAGLLATKGSGPLDRGTRVAAAVSWSGPMDLTIEAARVDRGEHDASGGLPKLLGCEVEHCPAAWARKASPVTYVDASDPPMMFTSARFDPVPLSTVKPMLDALTAVGIEHELVIAPGAGHSETLAPAVSGDTLRFLAAQLAEAPAAGPEPPP
jgi:acetyl esterase/lipase